MNRSRIFLTLPVLAVLALTTGCPERKADVYRQTPVSVSAADLAQAFQDEAKGAEKFTGKIVKVTGIAETTGADSANVPFVTLRGSGGTDVQCFFADSVPDPTAQIKKGQTVTVQGICRSKVTHIAVSECVFPAS